MKTIKYTVQAGDMLGTIAKQHGIELSKLYDIQGNEKYKNPSTPMHPGDTVFVPAKYVVMPSSANIAAAHGTTRAKLTEIPGNEKIKSGVFLKDGDVVKLPGDQTTYIVQQGDRLAVIAKQHGIGLKELLELAGNEAFKKNPDVIHPGEKVIVPSKYTVIPTLHNIAAQHGTTEKALLAIPGNEKYASNPLHSEDVVLLGNEG